MKVIQGLHVLYKSQLRVELGKGRSVRLLQEKVKELRHKMNWSKEDLASRPCVSYSTVHRWETRGDKPHPLALKELKKLFWKVGVKE